MTFYKVIVGILGGSSALVADGIHSFTDVIGTSVILFSRKVSDQEADASHPYGHGKVEFLGSAFIYTVLLVLSIAIFVGGLMVIVEDRIVVPQFVTLLAAGVSVFYNVFMYLFGQCAGKKNNSPAILANSFENRADAISSFAVIIGIAAALFIHPICDPLAAMLVGVIIFVNCIDQLKESVSGLMDTSLPREVIQRISKVAEAQDGVVRVDYVKTRQTGTGYWVDVGVVVPPQIDVEVSHNVSKAVRMELMRRSDRFERVEVFVVPDLSMTEEQCVTP
jgi:cation diffusion facilitator family transporter